MTTETNSGLNPAESLRIAHHYALLDTIPRDDVRAGVFKELVFAYREKYGAVYFDKIEESLRREDSQMHLLAVQPPADAKKGFALSDVNDFDRDTITPCSYAITTRLTLDGIKKAALEHRFQYNARNNLIALGDAGFFKPVPNYGERRAHEARQEPRR